MVSRALPANSFHMYMWVNIGLFLYIYNIYIHPHPPRERLCLSYPSLTPLQSSRWGCEDRSWPHGEKGPRGSHTALLPTPCTPPAHDTGSGATAPPWGSKIPGHPQAGEGRHTPQGLFPVCWISRAQAAMGGCGRTSWRSHPGGSGPLGPSQGGGPAVGFLFPIAGGAPTLQLHGGPGGVWDPPPSQGTHRHCCPGVRGQGCRGWWVCGAIRQLCPGPAHS